jgi:hypothetical protein
MDVSEVGSVPVFRRLIFHHSDTTAIFTFSHTYTHNGKSTVMVDTDILLDLHIVILHIHGRDSSVGIATGYGLDGRGVGVRVPVGVTFLSSPRRRYRFWDPLTSYPMDTGVKRSVREADHSPPTVPRSRTCRFIHPLPHTYSWRSA